MLKQDKKITISSWNCRLNRREVVLREREEC